jgi:hypothetical protein
VQLQQVEQEPLGAEVCRAPAPCSFLKPGLFFVGNQKLLQRGSLQQEDQWSVQVTLHVSPAVVHINRVAHSVLSSVACAGPVQVLLLCAWLCCCSLTVQAVSFGCSCTW